MSPALLAEIAEVLSLPRIRQRVTAEEAQQFLSDLAAQVVIIRDAVDPPRICRDPDDDCLVALARHSGPMRWSPATTTYALLALRWLASKS